MENNKKYYTFICVTNLDDMYTQLSISPYKFETKDLAFDYVLNCVKNSAKYNKDENSPIAYRIFKDTYEVEGYRLDNDSMILSLMPVVKWKVVRIDNLVKEGELK